MHLWATMRMMLEMGHGKEGFQPRTFTISKIAVNGYVSAVATESLNQTRRILNPGEQLLPWLKTNKHDWQQRQWHHRTRCWYRGMACIIQEHHLVSPGASAMSQHFRSYVDKVDSHSCLHCYWGKGTTYNTNLLLLMSLPCGKYCELDTITLVIKITWILQEDGQQTFHIMADKFCRFLVQTTATFLSQIVQYDVSYCQTGICSIAETIPVQKITNMMYCVKTFQFVN